MKKMLLIVFLAALVAVYFIQDSLNKPLSETSEPVATSTPEEIIKEAGIVVTPAKIIQGEPLLIQIENLVGTSTVKSISFDGATIPVFTEDGKPSALVGIDLRGRVGAYPVVVTLSSGEVLKKEVVVGARKIETAPLGIPDKLGGNTPASEQELTNTLIEEGKIISAIKVSDEKLWTAPFAYPLAPPITITDVYGYSRETGASSFSHKGTDFRAAIGTPVMAIGDGKVAYVGYLRNYGHVIGVDHGARALSIYMHLSKVSVAVGQGVKKGEVIGLSGDTGYVLGPHLHLTVRINAISIDPLKFLELLGE